MSDPVFTVANQLTLLRMALAPVLVLLVLDGAFVWASVVFAVAGGTDVLDGIIARRGHQRTTLGAMMDPVADKILMTASFVVLTWASGLIVRIPVWLTIVTLSRDLIIVVSVVIINLTLGRRVFLPSWLGKATTAAQIATAGVVLLLNAVGQPHEVARWVFLATGVLTVTSAVHYTFSSSSTKGETRP